MAGTDFSHLTNDELIKGIQALKLPDYIRSKAYGVDVRETLAQMTEMTIQLGVNMGLSPEEALNWSRKLQETVSQSEFDSWVATLLDGGPSIFMNTLSELQSTYPNGAAGVALVRETDPAKIYVWNGSAWEDFGAYQGIEIKDGSVTSQKIDSKAVTARKVEYLQQGLNLFDKRNRVEGVTINEAGGETINTLYDSSDFTPVQVGTHTVGPARFVALYDKDKNFIEHMDIAPVAKKTFEVTEEGFVRFSFLNRLNGADKAMLVRGSSLPSEYEPYYFEMKEPIKVTDKNILGKLTENVMNFLSSKNLFNKESITRKAVLEVTNGNVSTGTDFSDTYAVSAFIPIKHGTVEMTAVRNYVLYDKDKNYLLGVDAPEEETIEIEQDGFIRLTFWSRDIDHTMVTNNEPLGEYQDYGRYYLDPKIRVTSDNLQSKDENEVISLHFGDSITGNGNLVDRINERTGYSGYNFAVGGTRLVDITTIANDYQYMNFLDLLRAKVSGDWKTIDSALGRLNDTDLTERINDFKNFSMYKVKYLSFMYGTNDIVTPTISIGEKDSVDSLTINGALNEVFDIIFTNWPHVKVFVLSPIIRGSLPNFEGTSDTYERNGVTIFDYVNTMEAKAQEFKVPFKNMLQESGINALNFNTFLADGVHPNSVGEDLIADVYSRFMLTH